MQVLIVLSTIIIIHQAATYNNDNQISVTTNYEVDKDGHKMLNNKAFYNYSNGSSESTPSYYFNAKDLYGYIKNSNQTASPVLKTTISDKFMDLIMEIINPTAVGFPHHFLT